MPSHKELSTNSVTFLSNCHARRVYVNADTQSEIRPFLTDALVSSQQRLSAVHAVDVVHHNAIWGAQAICYLPETLVIFGAA